MCVCGGYVPLLMLVYPCHVTPSHTHTYTVQPAPAWWWVGGCSQTAMAMLLDRLRGDTLWSILLSALLATWVPISVLGFLLDRDGWALWSALFVVIPITLLYTEVGRSVRNNTRMCTYVCLHGFASVFVCLFECLPVYLPLSLYQSIYFFILLPVCLSV